MKRMVFPCISWILALLVGALVAFPGAGRSRAAPASPALGLLAYVQKGDIWVQALPGGEARRLTTTGGNHRPRWSSSGQWLAFGHASQVWVMQADGRAFRAVHKGASIKDFAWAPNADRLAYLSGKGERQEELWVMEPGGGEPLLLAPLSHPTYGMAWSPDGEMIAYLDLKKIVPEKWEVEGGLSIISRQGGTPRRLKVPLPAGGTPGFPELARWAGSYLLYWQAEEVGVSIMADGAPLYALPAQGGEPRLLSGEEIDGMLMHRDFLAPSPDGKLLALAEGGGRETWTDKRIVVVELTSGSKTVLTGDKSASFSPAWSPDGSRIAYVSQPDMGDLLLWSDEDETTGQGKRRIWVMNRDGSGRRALTRDEHYGDDVPRWSASGTHILFGRLSREPEEAMARASLWLMAVDGGQPVKVADELTRAPGRYEAAPGEKGFGFYGEYYGHFSWDAYFDWWSGPR